LPFEGSSIWSHKGGAELTAGGLFQHRKMSRLHFLQDRLHRTREILLDPVCRMIRLSDSLYLGAVAYLHYLHRS
jgi:hypothetical protein